MIQIGDAGLNKPLLGYWRRITPVKIPNPYYVALPASNALTDIVSATITLTEVSDIKAEISGMLYCDLGAAGQITWSINFDMDGAPPVDQSVIAYDQYGSGAGDRRLNFSLCYHWTSLAVGAHVLKFQACESAQTARTRRVYRACLITEVCKA